jgi:hypothetical protein
MDSALTCSQHQDGQKASSRWHVSRGSQEPFRLDRDHRLARRQHCIPPSPLRPPQNAAGPARQGPERAPLTLAVSQISEVSDFLSPLRAPFAIERRNASRGRG